MGSVAKLTRSGGIKQRRNALRAALGGRCSYCGSQGELHFDCELPAGHEHHRRGSKFRALFYALQHRQNNVQLLCDECEEVKRQQDQLMLALPAAADQFDDRR